LTISGVLEGLFSSKKRRAWLAIVITAILMFQLWLWVEMLWVQFGYMERFALFGFTFLLLVLISWERIYKTVRKR